MILFYHFSRVFCVLVLDANPPKSALLARRFSLFYDVVVI